MSNPNDLLDPLRFKSLGEYSLQDIRDIGGGVFTQQDTLSHLALLDSIAKAYRSVHLPSYGHLLAASEDNITPPSIWEGDSASSAGFVGLAELQPNQVRRYQAICGKSTESGTTMTIYIYNPKYNKQSAVVSQELTTSTIEQNLLSEPLEIAYPQQILIQLSSSGTVATTYNATSCLTQQ